MVGSASGWVAGLGCVVFGGVVYCVVSRLVVLYLSWLGCVVSELVGLAVLDQDWLLEGSA